MDAVLVEAGDVLLRFFLCNGDKGDLGHCMRLFMIRLRNSCMDCSKNCLVSELVCLISLDICWMSDLCVSLFRLIIASCCC